MIFIVKNKKSFKKIIKIVVKNSQKGLTVVKNSGTMKLLKNIGVVFFNVGQELLSSIRCKKQNENSCQTA
jgi:hypothetical protein